MNETIFHRCAPDAPCFCVGHDGHDPECACAASPEGGDQSTSKTSQSVAGAQIWVVPKAIMDAIDRLADCAESDGMFKMDPDGDGSCPESTAPAKAALLRLLSENANSRYGVESSACGMILQNRPQIIRKIIPTVAGPWIWSDDELPPVNVPVLRIDPDNVDNLGQVEVVTRAGGIENNKGWVEYPAWWMRIPPAPGVTS